MTKWTQNPQQWWQAMAGESDDGETPVESSAAAEPTPAEGGLADVGDDPNDAEFYSDLIAQFDGDDVEDPQLAELPAAEEPPAPETKPPAEPVETEPTPAPEAQPQQPPQPAESAVQQQPAPAAAEPQPTPESINDDYRAFFDNTVGQLAEKVYALDEATAEQLDTEPSKAIPRLAATLHMQVLTAAMTQMANMFPTLAQQYAGQSETFKKNEDTFFSRFPDLKGKEDLVRRVGQSYRQLNPNATTEQLIEEIGAMSMVAARIEPQTAATPDSQAPVPPPPPTAVQGGAPPKPVPKGQQNWLTELIEEEE